MKVKELRKLLAKCDPNAKVEIEGYDAQYELTGIEETFYSYPANKYVELISNLSIYPPEYQEKMKLFEKYIQKIKEIQKIIDEK